MGVVRLQLLIGRSATPAFPVGSDCATSVECGKLAKDRE